MSVRVSSDLLRADMPVGGVAGSENYSGASAAGSPAVDSNNLNDHDDESGELDARRPGRRSRMMIVSVAPWQ